MNYYPRYKTCEQLLLLNGFVIVKKGFGYERKHPNTPPKHRLHATAYHGYISLHYDIPGGPNGHQAKSHHKQVRRCIKELEKLDVSDYKIKRFLDNLLQYGKKQKAKEKVHTMGRATNGQVP